MAIMSFIFEESAEVFRYQDEFILIKAKGVGHISHPVKLNFTIGIICLAGQMTGRSNMGHFVSKKGDLTILLANFTLTIESLSADFSALFILMSPQFTANLQIEERLPIFLSLHNNPSNPLNRNELNSLKDYFRSAKKILKEVNNSRTIKIIQHLTIAYFYAIGYNVHHLVQRKQSRQEELVEKFLYELQNNFKTEREIKFYSDKLFVTPKYLSKIVKMNNGLSAKQWIDDYVIWEAKALLKSTSLTIQQISDDLNFPSQSFFGKYFYRLVGVSPSAYRKG